MEDGDDDTSPTAGFKHNGKPICDENNVTTENEEGKVSFSNQGRLSSFSSKEEFSHSESGDLDKEEDISDQDSENKSSDLLSDANTSLVLEDNDCDKIQKLEESESMGPSDVTTTPAVIEPSGKMVYERDNSEFLDVPGEVSNSKDDVGVFANMESAGYAHSTMSEEETETNENKEENSSLDELVSTSSEVHTTDETPDTSLTHNESNVKSESGEEEGEGELNESLALPCSVTANCSGDVSTGSDLNQSDSNSEGHDESFEEVASQEYKDTSETLDSSSNVNVSNETDSSDSLISQSSADNSVSQPDGHNPCSEETDNVDRLDVSVLDTMEPEGLCEPVLLNEDDDKLSASEESESECVREEELCSDKEEQEMETSDSLNEKDCESCISNISNVGVEMKRDEDVEEMEVDSYEWKENEIESGSVAETDGIDVGEGPKKDNEVNDERSDAMCVDDDTSYSSEDEIEQSEVRKQQCEEMDKKGGKETFENLEKSEYVEDETESCANIDENVGGVERDVNLEAEDAHIEKENEEQGKVVNLEMEKESDINIEGGESEKVDENRCFEAEKESCTDIEENIVELEKNESLEVESESHDHIEKDSSVVPEEDKYSEIGNGLDCTDGGSCEEVERKVFSEIGNESHTYSEDKNSEMETEMSDNPEGKEINSQALDLEDSMCESEEGEKIQKSQTPEIMKDGDKYLDSTYIEHKDKGVSGTSSGQSSPSDSFFLSKDIVTETSKDLSERIKKSKSFEMEIDDSSVKVNGEVECTQGDTEEQQEPIKEKVILKRKLEDSPTQELSSDTAVNESCKLGVCFKGFKKRYIAQVSEAEMKHEEESPTINEDTKVNNRSVKTVIMEPTQVIVSHQQIVDREESETPLTEYAQYLGLQPTVKFKCYNCGESGFPSMMKLQEHQNTCLKNDNSQCLNRPPPSPSPEPLPSTNFRITRKVYLCSACGTYYENWNLFIHMKEVHNRHICLFCLVMFSQAEKLAAHLFTKHGISEGDFDTPQDFLNEFNSAFFVMCCTCEQLFNESDNFFDHPCGTVAENVADQACSLCGLRGAHFPTCRRAFTDSSAVTSPPHNSSQTALPNSELPPSVQSSVQEKVPKYLGPLDKSSNRKSHQKQPDKNNASEKRNRSEYCDDDYDISDAASYCHVNIDEPEKQKNLSQRTVNETSEENCESAIDSKKPSGDSKVDKQDIVPREPEDPQCAEEEETSKIESCDRIHDSPPCHPEQESENPVEKELSQSSESSELLCHDTSNDSKSPTAEPHESMDLSETQISGDKEADANVEISSLNHSKSPKEGDSESDSSASAGDTHGSDDSSSGSEASSDENDTENKGPSEVVKPTVSDVSDGDKSDSDKMSIVVDDTRSGDDDPDKEEKITDCNTVSTPNENIENYAEDCKNDAEFDVTMNEEKSLASNNDSEDQQDNIQVAGDDVPLLELTLEETMDALPIQAVVKECVKISCGTCVYCNHAKKIAVNGKQLVLHLLAEHRFEPVVCSDSGELTPINGFVENLKAKLTELQDMYFNTDSYDSADKTFSKPYDRTYECFHCHFITTLHKELYVHNRKMHQKTILLCIMCKSNFYSYSELLCHLCPGIYVPDSNIAFRCCVCVVDGLPSAFRLMVHLRKRHHACDVCLETTGDQQKLSNHVWKHKLHHLCYRCGIAYRNKPDITKHLFWKHGTESVLCKKCLQKKWPHVYHFCIPPTAFLCEECNASFSRAVALKVHKRLHVGDIAYECDECQEKFISKKLLRRHKDKHKQADEEEKIVENSHENKMGDYEPDEANIKNEQISSNQGGVDLKTEEKESLQEHGANIGTHKADGEDALPQPVDPEINKMSDETTNKRSKVVDVYDLPPLNLSSESDDSEDESAANKKSPEEVEPEEPKVLLNQQADESTPSKPPQEGETQTEEETQPVEIVDGVWDNFKNYKASLEKREILQAQGGGSLKTTETLSSLPSGDLDSHTMMNIVLAEHDYCIVPDKPTENAPNSGETVDSLKKVEVLSSQNDSVLDEKGDAFGADHNYCYNTSPGPEDRKESTEAVAVAQAPIPHSPQTPPSQLSSQIHTAPATSTPNSSPKKKQKSPKKKQKQSGSSSSSDSSSNSDSSSCTCGTNCSCSSSSSSSSGSSSSSSDSDSSSSEGRRRQAARRERRRERAKRKLDTESRGGSPPASAAVESQADQMLNSAPTQIDSSGGLLQVDDGPLTGRQEPEESEFTIRESDLDTTETETDEDFYDKYPQRQANKLLAEKRNQLLLLAAVAPVNNGTINQPSSPPPAPTVELSEPVQKKKGKTKRHKKAQHHVTEKKVENKLKLNIPASYYNNPSFSIGNPHLLASPIVNSQNVASSHTSRISHETFSPVPEAASTPTAYHSTGSGSETESKRLSKRKRIPKKFYGDSSDEEAEHSSHQPYKWRKVVSSSNSNPPPALAPVPSVFTFRNVNVSVPAPEPVRALPLQTKSDDDGDDSDSAPEAKRSSSDSSNSDSDNEHSDGDSDVETAPSVTNMLSSASGNMNQQKNENLYCYCQCPYDEVSEMIACDGKDCSIEWFHFECVGIMVPPKGKWFCPDCRKKTAARSEYLLHA